MTSDDQDQSMKLARDVKPPLRSSKKLRADSDASDETKNGCSCQSRVFNGPVSKGHFTGCQF